mgnify:CR=1 FL=1
MSNVLFMASTPLHSLWALGIAAGSFPDARCALVLIDQRDGDRDWIAETLADRMSTPFVEMRRFSEIGKTPWRKLTHARARMREVTAFTRQFAPDYVAVGNDRRAEFFAALAAAPQAMGAYLDDGTASYNQSPVPSTSQSPVIRRVVRGFRSWIYGVPTEQEPYLGTSQAVQEAWVAWPEQVHAGLRSKRLHAIRPEWFQLPQVQTVCAEACRRAGLDHGALEGVQLLLAMPHDSLVRRQPGIRVQLQALVDRTLGQGGRVAIKRHPRSQVMPLTLPDTGVIEVPQRLPLEILAPLLSGTEVVGMLTSALIYFRCLNAGVRVASLVPDGYSESPILNIYRSLGVRLLS